MIIYLGGVMDRNIKDDLIMLGISIIGFVITAIMMKFLYNTNQVFKIITFILAMLSSALLVGVLHHFWKNFTKKDYWKK
jgi:hypothetical protein